MYSAVKSWLNIPMDLVRFIKYDGMGDASYEDPETIMSYVQSSNQLVRNANGNEVVSKTQFYIEGATQVKNQDNVIFEGNEEAIISISVFYDETGAADLKVVHI